MVRHVGHLPMIIKPFLHGSNTKLQGSVTTQPTALLRLLFTCLYDRL